MTARRPLNPFKPLLDLAAVEFPADYSREALAHDLRRVFDSDAGRRVLVWLASRGHLLDRVGQVEHGVQCWVEGRRALALEVLGLWSGDPSQWRNDPTDAEEGEGW